MVKNLPECGRSEFNPWVRKMSWLKELATNSSILAWKIPWTEELGGLQSMGLQKSQIQQNSRHGKQKSIVSLYTNSEKSVKKIMKTIIYDSIKKNL